MKKTFNFLVQGDSNGYIPLAIEQHLNIPENQNAFLKRLTFSSTVYDANNKMIKLTDAIFSIYCEPPAEIGNEASFESGSPIDQQYYLEFNSRVSYENMNIQLPNEIYFAGESIVIPNGVQYWFVVNFEVDYI
jgi:hypothetical protein